MFEPAEKLPTPLSRRVRHRPRALSVALLTALVTLPAAAPMADAASHSVVGSAAARGSFGRGTVGGSSSGSDTANGMSSGSTVTTITISTPKTSRFSAPRSITIPAKHLRPAAHRRAAAKVGAGTVGAGSPTTNAMVGPMAIPLPIFSGSFSSGGRTYSYRMVGTNPAGPAATTLLDNTIAPIALTVAGRTFATSSAITSNVAASGMYNTASLPGGPGQYGDIFMRTQFWPALNNGTKNWHVLMKPPVIAPSVTLSVPADKGAWTTLSGIATAFVDVDWFDAQTAGIVRAAEQSRLTQLLTTNVVLCTGFNAALPIDQNDCGIGGYHSAYFDENGGHTYLYASYLHGAIYGANSGFYGIGPMSHELAEWLADPYVDNAVPVWLSPIAPQYGCLDILESADPVVGKFYLQNGYPYADNAYLSWFARQKPSQAWQGRYTWLNSLTTFSSSNGC